MDNTNFENNNIENATAKVVVGTDPNTGVSDIIGNYNESDYENLESSFESMTESIDDIDVDEDIEIDDSPVTDEEIATYMSGDNAIIKDLSESDKAPDLSIEATKELLTVVNRKIKGEKFNPYKEFPQEIKDIIDSYVNKYIEPNNIVNINAIKKSVSEALLDDFINDIQMNRIKNDFSTDLENLYKDSIKEIAEGTLNYIDERNKAYRESADQIEDQEKKEKMLAILDQIDEARALTSLKEYAKTCKIKPIELEKPANRIYSSFLFKYKNSSNNIYDINIAKKVLFRHLESKGYTIKDIDAFLICFCKQVKNYSPAKATEHAYMYYVLYYCALLDGDNSTVFIDNISEVINNLRERNPGLLK